MTDRTVSDRLVFDRTAGIERILEIVGGSGSETDVVIEVGSRQGAAPSEANIPPSRAANQPAPAMIESRLNPAFTFDRFVEGNEIWVEEIDLDKLLGGDDGIPISRGPGAVRMQDSLGVHDLTVFRFDADVMLQGYLKPRQSIDNKRL